MGLARGKTSIDKRHGAGNGRVHDPAYCVEVRVRVRKPITRFVFSKIVKQVFLGVGHFALRRIKIPKDYPMLVRRGDRVVCKKRIH